VGKGNRHLTSIQYDRKYFYSELVYFNVLNLMLVKKKYVECFLTVVPLIGRIITSSYSFFSPMSVFEFLYQFFIYVDYLQKVFFIKCISKKKNKVA